MLFWFSTLYPLILSSLFFKRGLLIIPWSILFLILAFRYNVGSDYPNYVLIYEGITSGNVEMLWLTMETGYLYLIYISNYIGGNFQLVFFIFALLTMMFMYQSFNKYLLNNIEKLLALLLFIPMFYFPSMSIVRQALAIAIFFYSIKFIVNRNFFKYFLFISLGFLFHKSIILMLPMYWLLNIKFNSKKYILYLIIASMLFFINPVNILEYIFMSLDLPYVRHIFKGEIEMSFFGKVNTILSFFIISIFAFILNRKNKFENLIINAMFIYVFIRIISIDFAILLRIAVFFIPIFIIFTILVYRNIIIKHKFNKQIVFVFLFFFILIYTSVGLYHKGYKDGSYNQYAMNLSLFGNNIEPIQIYGDYNDMYVLRDTE